MNSLTGSDLVSGDHSSPWGREVEGEPEIRGKRLWN